MYTFKTNAFHVKLTSFNLSGVSINFNKSFEFLINVRAIHLFAFTQFSLSFVLSLGIANFITVSISISIHVYHQLRCMPSIRISRVVAHFRGNAQFWNDQLWLDAWSGPLIHLAFQLICSQTFLWRSIVLGKEIQMISAHFGMNTMTYFDWELYNRSNFIPYFYVGFSFIERVCVCVPFSGGMINPSQSNIVLSNCFSCIGNNCIRLLLGVVLSI